MRHIYQGSWKDGNGSVIDQGDVTVYLAGTTTPATIYTALSGGSADSDSVVSSNSSGFFSFYVDEADYAADQFFKIVLSKNGYQSSTYDDINIFGYNVPLDESVTTAKLATNAVTTVKITDASVTTAKIADGNVTASKLATSSVSTIKLVASSVTTAKIADANVTTAKIGTVPVSTFTYSNSTSGLTATDPQDAIDEVLLNTERSSVLSVGGTVASSALTLTLAANTVLDFRSTTLGTGSTTGVKNTSELSIVVSSGSTLGTTNAVKSKIVIVAINNAGTIELACVNIAGGVNLDETTLINTVSEGGSGGADLDNVFYSTTARTGVAFRVVGYAESTQATAGTWATAPSLVQGVGGQAMTALSSVGYGQRWVDVTAQRSPTVVYYNTTGKPIVAHVSGTVSTAGNRFGCVIDGVSLLSSPSSNTAYKNLVTCIIPPGSSYQITAVSVENWIELR